MNQQERDNLIAMVQDADNIEMVNEIMKGFEYFTLEDKKEIICAGMLKSSIEKNPTFLMWVIRPEMYKELARKRAEVHEGQSIEPMNEETCKAVLVFCCLKETGYQGRRLLTRNKKQYAQFYCGKSKPSFEIEITPTI